MLSRRELMKTLLGIPIIGGFLSKKIEAKPNRIFYARKAIGFEPVYKTFHHPAYFKNEIGYEFSNDGCRIELFPPKKEIEFLEYARRTESQHHYINPLTGKSITFDRNYYIVPYYKVEGVSETELHEKIEKDCVDVLKYAKQDKNPCKIRIIFCRGYKEENGKHSMDVGIGILG